MKKFGQPNEDIFKKAAEAGIKPEDTFVTEHKQITEKGNDLYRERETINTELELTKQRLADVEGKLAVREGLGDTQSLDYRRFTKRKDSLKEEVAKLEADLADIDMRIVPLQGIYKEGKNKLPDQDL